MSSETADQLPSEILFHCRTCNATRDCPDGELHRCIVDRARWPVCCGQAMAVSFPHGHPEMITG